MDWSWLSTNSSLLTIRSGQQNSWPNAHADLNNVLNSIESAWTFLKTDTDTEYDAITKDMVEDDDMDPDDMTVSEYIDDIRDILNNHYVVELDFGDCDQVCDGYDCWDECTEKIVEITVDIKGFLTDPPQNLKTLLPPYAVSTGACQWEDGCYGDWSPTGEYYEVCEDSGIWGCPELTWEAYDCDAWKAGWDYEVGGLFPNMTQNKFFNDIVGENIDPEDCEEILEGSFDF